MKVRLKSDTFLVLAFNIVLLMIEVIYLAVMESNANIYSKWSVPATIFSLISIVLNLLAIRKLRIDIMDFRFVFMMLLYLFMYGRIWLNCFGLDGDIFWVLHTFFRQDVMANSSMYCVCCIQAIFLGLLFVGKEKYSQENGDISESGRLFLTGIFLLLIGLPCRLYFDINSIKATVSTGSYLSISALTGLIDDLSVLFIPGVLCIMESKPKKRIGIFGVVIVYFLIVMSLTGDRRYYVTSIIALGAYLLFKMQQEKQKSTKKELIKYVLIGALAVFFLSFLEVLREIRANGLGSFSAFLTNHGSNVFILDDLLYEVLAEFGISFFSVVNVIDNVPDVMPFQYGMTFVRTLPSILPIGFLLGDFFEMATPSTIINVMTINGLGSTLFGDLYANFGYFGILASFFSGTILSKLINPNKRHQKGINLVMYYSLYSIMINLVRCTVFEVYRSSIWLSFIVYIAYRSSKRKR